MKKNLIFLLILIILSISILSGCRKKDPKDTAPKDKVELTYYKVFDDADVIEPLINAYQAKNPWVEINYKKFDDFGEYQRVILNEMAEDEGPDIFSMQNTWFASNYKKIYPMPETIGTPKSYQSVFVDVAAKDLLRVDDNGLERIYGIPMTVDTLALYYNNAHFQDRLPEQGKPSLTWDGILEDIAKLKKEDNSFERFEVAGLAMGLADNIGRSVDIYYMLLLQYGAKFYNKDISEAVFATAQSAIKTYPAIDALKFYQSFADSDQKHYTWNEYMVQDDFGDKEIDAFAKGKVSMIFGYAYTYDDIVNRISILKSRGVDTIEEEDIKIAPSPQLFDPKVSTEKRVTYANYFAETVSRNSKNPEVAWDFLVFLTSKDSLEEYFENTNKPTSRRDMIEDQKRHPKYSVFASQIGYAESFPVLDYYTYKDLFSKVINGEMSLLDAQTEITRLLPEGGLIKEKKENVDAKKASDKKD